MKLTAKQQQVVNMLADGTAITYRHHWTGWTGFIDFETDHEVGIDCGGFTWTGTIEEFETLWERA